MCHMHSFAMFQTPPRPAEEVTLFSNNTWQQNTSAKKSYVGKYQQLRRVQLYRSFSKSETIVILSFLLLVWF